jgi:glycosyltransferase involved in cell wall biosynthesis
LIYNNISEIPKHFFAGTPVIIPSFNQLYYIKNTIKQLKRFGLENFIILDNGSTYRPLIKWFTGTPIPVIINSKNPGPRDFFVNQEIWGKLPNYFIVTDPDLEYPNAIPDSLVSDLIEISEEHKWAKVALGLYKEDAKNMVPMVKDWEVDYWKNVIAETKTKDPIYEAKTDTTFALYNKKFVTRPYDLSWDGNFFTAPRVCGKYLCKHWGWYYKKPVPKDEYAFYKNTITHWSSTEHELRRRGIDT